jgi:hypothetical protein
MKDHIKLDNNESDLLLRCLLRAAAVGRSTGNLGLAAMATELTDLIINKWFDEGDSDV